jgi:hypothetical protein
LGQEVTINIAVVTSDALVLGCDSVASVTTPMLNPFGQGFTKGEDGNFVKDKDGNFLVPVKGIEHIVTDVMSGVTKMFKLYDEKNTVVAATTSGLGKLNDRPIAGIAYDFAQSIQTPKKGKQKYTKVLEVVNAFHEFVRVEYENDQTLTGIPPEYWSSLSFLVGGHGKDDKFPSVYRIRMKETSVVCEFELGKTGMCWGGQSDSIERIIRGYDGELRHAVEEYVGKLLDSHHKKMAETTVRILGDTLTALKVEMPNGVNTDLPAIPPFELDWDRFRVGVNYSNLPLQDAINFVSFLVLTQEGKQKFAPGLATVGGRIHVGYATKAKGFNFLNELELTHNQTGFPYEH